ncbi:bacterial extracellular solute-binding family protein [Lyngbya aestuarii BL J]|uniref:Bacterial extracellular solute-binding family protein n=1 Tax=Lyngbya aestuarii BL J TaxID=1348334 RepID=U7QKF4_9CYAN|nr:extracellular solute-binding protein [Lyngbya aestuarii]ERT08424.1 bacterial extracellular solute-binding family protein [Lyngbya aestuarii BL J]
MGCRQTTALKIELLKGSVPVQMVNKFRRELSADRPVIDFVPQAQLKDLYQLLQPEEKKSRPENHSSSDLIMIGDYWLTQAIQQQLVQPLDPQVWQRWNQLPPQWQALVTRNAQGELDPQGQVWAAPYRWGTTAIAYRREQFETLGWTPQDWGDLWREDIRDRISVLDNPRETIGLTLKKLGSSYNITDLDLVVDLEDQFRQLHRNIKLYDSNTYLKPLITGDTWLAVGWSTDFSEKFRRQHNIGVVIPASGTALWADLWVQPTSEKPISNLPLAQQWIDFCWKPEIATQMSILTGTTSPIVNQLQPSELPETLQNNPLLFPKAEILEKSEFLLPLPESTLKQYQALWIKIRTETVGS